MGLIRQWLVPVALMGAAAAILFVAAFLQEFHGNDLEDRLATLGLRLPLKDPRIEISCNRFAVELFDGDVMVKRYEAGFGRSPVSGRIGRDIASTPHGEYRITKKQIREDILTRGSRCFLLNYPNTGDAKRALDVLLITREEFERVAAAERYGDPPPYDTALGGPLYIQGNYFFFRERHYTDGSVAMGNGDINELFDYVAVGTPVIIKD